MAPSRATSRCCARRRARGSSKRWLSNPAILGTNSTPPNDTVQPRYGHGTITVCATARILTRSTAASNLTARAGRSGRLACRAGNGWASPAAGPAPRARTRAAHDPAQRAGPQRLRRLRGCRAWEATARAVSGQWRRDAEQQAPSGRKKYVSVLGGARSAPSRALRLRRGFAAVPCSRRSRGASRQGRPGPYRALIRYLGCRVLCGFARRAYPARGTASRRGADGAGRPWAATSDT